MEKYSSYKDSGVQWLGEIPSHWDVISLKHLANISSGSTPSSSVEKYWNGNVRWITPADFKTETKYVSCGIRNITEEGVSACSTVVLPQNSVVFSKRAPVGQVSITTEELCVNQGCIACVPNSKVISTFLYYLLSVYRNEFDFFSVGTTFREISLKEFSSFKVSVPSILEQELIVKYLDSATSKIDTAISQQQKMIDLLNERKQIIINNAVTKGLDPNVKMKDSGNICLGEIPEHWDCFKTLYALSMPITDGPHETPVIYDSGIPFLSAEAVSGGFLDFNHMRGYISQSFYNECCKKYIPQKYDVYMIKSGATTGRTAIVETDEIFTIWSPLAVFRANIDIIDPYFLLYSLRSTYYIRQVELGWTYGTQQNIGMRTLEKLMICVPPIKEQSLIVNHLKERLGEIDNAIASAEKQISLLQERKQIIINEVVTGKVKVL